MYVIMYHYVRKIKNSKYPEIKGLELDFFKQQIKFLLDNGFKFVTMQDVLEGNISEKSILLTFDDGYLDHYDNVFPILHENKIQGVFSMPGKIIREKKVLDVNKIHYILASTNIELLKKQLFHEMNYFRGSEYDYPSNDDLYEEFAIANRFDNKDVIFVKRILQVALPEFVRNQITDKLFREFVTNNEVEFVNKLYMNLEQIREMKSKGMYFAYHGYDHYWMDSLKKEELRKDINDAMNVFEKIINPNDWSCCYPYGAYNDDVIRIAKEMGATSGFTTAVAKYDNTVHNILKIPRLDTNDFPPKSDNYIDLY